MIRTGIWVLLMMLSSALFAQVNYEVKLMSWNLLNFPSNSNTVQDTSARCPAYRTVVNYAQPDILVTMENTSVNSAPWFLDQVMNTGSYHYATGLFINGYDSDNAIFFRDSMFDFIANLPVHTALRDINDFVLRFRATGDTLHIFSCHLKASQGYETQRAAEVANLRAVTNAFPPGTNFFIAGDFNIYTSTEPAYAELLQDNPNDDGNFLDPLTMTGVWNNSIYAPYHTQSTHFTSSGGFSGGGMNDRFDMILYSNAVAQGGGVYYMPGTYHNIGNDGHHFGDAINYGTNSAVPLTVANGLYNASDHLPVMLSLMIGPNSGIEEQANENISVDVFPNPVVIGNDLNFTLSRSAKITISISNNIGLTVLQQPGSVYDAGLHSIDFSSISELNPGYYLLSMLVDKTLINKKIIVIR